jgi:hypothetical protein
MGVYSLRMTREKFERLPAVLREIGLPDPQITRDEGGFVFNFKLGVLKKLRVDVLVPEGGCKTYELWIPPTKSGEELFGELQRRGHYRNPVPGKQGTASNGGRGEPFGSPPAS